MKTFRNAFLLLVLASSTAFAQDQEQYFRKVGDQRPANSEILRRTR